MSLEVWVGYVEVRQLPGTDHKIMLSGRGAFTWVTCWASDLTSFQNKVSEVMGDYGLFIVDVENVMPFAKAELEEDIVTDELLEQFEDTSKNEQFCIYGTFYNYMSDH
jgi:hypothetical protein